MKIIWSAPAKRRLADYKALLAEEIGETNAAAWAEKLLRGTRLLATHPQAGRVVPEVARPDIRELLYRVHRVIYQVDTETATCTILSLRHVRQDTTPDNYDA